MFFMLFVYFSNLLEPFLFFFDVAPVYWNLFEIVFNLFLEFPQYTALEPMFIVIQFFAEVVSVNWNHLQIHY